MPCWRYLGTIQIYLIEVLLMDTEDYKWLTYFLKEDLMQNLNWLLRHSFIYARLLGDPIGKNVRREP